MNARHGVSVAFGLVAIATGTGWWWQHETGNALRSELELLRYDQQTLARLRTEQEKLRAARASDDEVARLRADRAALAQLRREIEAMQARVARAKR